MSSNKTVNVDGISEFIPKKAPAPAPKARLVVTIGREDHDKLSEMAKAAAKTAGRFVSLGMVVNSLIQHYESYE